MNLDTFLASTAPYTDDDGNSYPFFAINLSIAGVPNADNTDISAAIATRLNAFRVDEAGTIHFAPLGEKSFVYGNAYETAATDPALAQCVIAIKTALQDFVTAKGV